MKNFFNSLKSMLGGDQDPRMSAIKKAMHSLGYDCKVSDDKKYASCEFPADNNLRYKSEVSLRLTEEDIDLTYTIYDTIALPQELAEKLADRFGDSFGLEGVQAYGPTEVSFTARANTLDAQFVEKYIDLTMDAIRDLWSDIDQAVVEVYNRAIMEAERQKAIAEAKAREEARQRKLNEGYTLTLRGGTTIRKIQEYFGEDYPYLKLNFYLVKTAQGAKKSESISHIDADLTLDQVRSFRGECGSVAF